MRSTSRFEANVKKQVKLTDVQCQGRRVGLKMMLTKLSTHRNLFQQIGETCRDFSFERYP